MRILIVEDEVSLARLIKDKLEKNKYIVDISNDGEDGLYNALLDIYAGAAPIRQHRPPRLFMPSRRRAA